MSNQFGIYTKYSYFKLETIGIRGRSQTTFTRGGG